MAGEIVYSNNPGDWTKYEALYVAQLTQEASVVGPNARPLGWFDQAVRGPTTAQVIGSPEEADGLYGTRDAGGGGDIKGLMWKGALNRKLSYPMVMCRVAASDAVKAYANAVATATPILKIEANNPGVWANNASGYGLSAAISAASDGEGTHYNVTVKYQGNTIAVCKNINTTTGNDNTASVVGTSERNMFRLVKLANGRPDNTVSDLNLASGTEGTIAASDYEAAFDKVAAHPLTRVIPIGCDVMGSTGIHATVNTYVQGKVGNFPTKIFYAWAGLDEAVAAEVSEKGDQLATGASNLVWCYNASSTQDSTGTLIETGSHLDAAVIRASVDVAIHLGDEQNIALLAGRKSVYNDSLSGGDFTTLRAAGITTLEHVTNGFKFRSAVCSNSTGPIGASTSVEEVDVVRKAWLIESFAEAIKHDVCKAATETRRTTIINKLTAFCSDDQKAEHVVAKADPVLGDGYKFKWVETSQERAANIGKLLCKVRMISYLLTIVMLIDIGTGVINVKTE